MKKLTEKAVKTALLLALPVTVFTVAYLLYNQPQTEAPTDDYVLYEDTNLQRFDSAKLSRLKASIDKELDSVEQLPTGSLWEPFYNNFISGTQQDTSLISRQLSDSLPAQNAKTDMGSNEVLQGPSDLFTRTYSLAIGKPVPVSVLWKSDSALLPAKYQLLTITLNDIAGNKAGFTLTDPSAVLLYSGANYAANDKISIEDETHNFHISVFQVYPNSVTIEFASYLNDNIVSSLQASE